MKRPAFLQRKLYLSPPLSLSVSFCPSSSSPPFFSTSSFHTLLISALSCPHPAAPGLRHFSFLLTFALSALHVRVYPVTGCFPPLSSPVRIPTRHQSPPPSVLFCLKTTSQLEGLSPVPTQKTAKASVQIRPISRTFKLQIMGNQRD